MPNRQVQSGPRAGNGSGGVVRDYPVVFDLSDEELPAGTDLMDEHHRVRIDSDCQVNLLDFAVQLKDAPVGAALIIDLQVSADNGTTWSSLFPSGNDQKLNVPPGEKRADTSTFAITVLHPDDILRLDILQVGSQTAGGRLQGTLRGRVEKT